MKAKLSVVAGAGVLAGAGAVWLAAHQQPTGPTEPGAMLMLLVGVSLLGCGLASGPTASATCSRSAYPTSTSSRRASTGSVLDAGEPVVCGKRRWAATLRLDGVLGDEQALGDRPVRAPFGHQGEHIEAIHTYEGTETMQTLIVGRDITGVGAFA